MKTGTTLHAETMGGLGPATAFPATLIEEMPNTEMRLIWVVKPATEARTNFAGVVPGLKGLRVEEYSAISVTPAFFSSEYGNTFAANTVPAAPVAVEVDADASNALAPASAAASNALCRRDLLSSTCAVSSASPAMAIKASKPTSTSTRDAPHSRWRTMAG